jgi:hypothetical protein
MEVHFTPELESKLTNFAAQQGRNPDELVQDVLTRYFKEEAASGAALVEAMQSSPYKDIDLEPKRDRLPVRDAVL